MRDRIGGEREDEVVEPDLAVAPVPPQQLHQLQGAAGGLAGDEDVAVGAHLGRVRVRVRVRVRFRVRFRV